MISLLEKGKVDEIWLKWNTPCPLYESVSSKISMSDMIGVPIIVGSLLAGLLTLALARFAYRRARIMKK